MRFFSLNLGILPSKVIPPNICLTLNILPNCIDSIGYGKVASSATTHFSNLCLSFALISFIETWPRRIMLRDTDTACITQTRIITFGSHYISVWFCFSFKVSFRVMHRTVWIHRIGNFLQSMRNSEKERVSRLVILPVMTLYRRCLADSHQTWSHQKCVGLFLPQVTLVTRSRVSSGCHSKYESNGGDVLHRNSMLTGNKPPLLLHHASSSYVDSSKERETFRRGGEIKNSNSIDTMTTNFPRLLWEKQRTLDDFSSSMLARNVKKKKKKGNAKRDKGKNEGEREKKKQGGEKWFFACTSTVMRESFLILSRVKLLRAKDVPSSA